VSTHAAPAEPADRLASAVSRTAAALVLGGSAASVFAGWIVWVSPLVDDPHAVGVLKGLLVASYVGVGTYSWWRRPASRLGPLIAGAGFLYAVTSLAAIDRSLPYTLGRVALSAQVLLLAYLFVSFPRDRPSTPLERRFVELSAGVLAVVWIGVLAFAQMLPHGGPLTDCTADCPPNAFQLVETSDGVSKAIGLLSSSVTALIVVLLIALLARKAGSETLIRRRAVAPLLYASILLAAAYAGYSLTAQASTPSSALRVVGVVGAFAVPAALLAGHLRGRLVAAASLWRAMGRVGPQHVTPAWMERFLGETLGDPSLALAVWSEADNGYLDVHAEPVDVPPSAESRTVTLITRNGSPSLALIHDPALDDDLALVRGLGATADILLENVALVTELQASRARLVDSAERERRRLERDLHDGAQQRLTSIQLKLAIASEETDPVELRAELEELAVEAAAVASELRSIAHGIYPPLLYEAGLAPALRSVARMSPLAVRMVDRGVGRASPRVELAIFYCALEALQNAAKHAGPEAQVVVTLDRTAGELEFEVRDDGRGFEPSQHATGIGLVSMRDRIGAAGGTLEIRSAPGRGTTVHGTVPAEGQGLEGGSPA
jgi:signal transduction histidine kinase